MHRATIPPFSFSSPYRPGIANSSAASRSDVSTGALHTPRPGTIGSCICLTGTLSWSFWLWSVSPCGAWFSGDLRMASKERSWREVARWVAIGCNPYCRSRLYDSLTFGQFRVEKSSRISLACRKFSRNFAIPCTSKMTPPGASLPSLFFPLRDLSSPWCNYLPIFANGFIASCFYLPTNNSTPTWNLGTT